MKPEYLKKIFEPELERSVALLKETDPRSEDYGRLLFAISELSYRLKSPFGADFTDDFPEVKPSEPDPEPDPVVPNIPEESAPEPEPEPAPTEDRPVVDTDDIKGDTEYINPEELRATLAVAKNKGVNIREFIASLGTTNFSSLRDDQNKLRQLKAMVEKALKEIT